MDKLTFSVVLKGACYLRVDGHSEPLHLVEGDVLLLATRRGFVLSSDLETAVTPAGQLFPTDGDSVVRIGDLGAGRQCVQAGGFVKIDPHHGGILADCLPAVIHVDASSSHAATVRWIVERIDFERTRLLPGSPMASNQLAMFMFIEILRAHLESGRDLQTGWLSLVADKQMAPALRLMHSDPGRSWSLDDLARECATSRTTFATRFRRVAGVPPLTYLSNWRMRLAERVLRDTDRAVSDIADSLGFSSESSFSHAFKRSSEMGPRAYRQRSRLTQADT
jgi:AraC-like DNA-binding protein